MPQNKFNITGLIKQTWPIPVMLVCLDWGFPTALGVLISFIPRDPSLCLADKVVGLGLAGGGCESGVLLASLGDGCQGTHLVLPSSKWALADSAWKENNSSLSLQVLCIWPRWTTTHKKKPPVAPPHLWHSYIFTFKINAPSTHHEAYFLDLSGGVLSRVLWVYSLFILGRAAQVLCFGLSLVGLGFSNVKTSWEL